MHACKKSEIARFCTLARAQLRPPFLKGTRPKHITLRILATHLSKMKRQTGESGRSRAKRKVQKSTQVLWVRRKFFAKKLSKSIVTLLIFDWKHGVRRVSVLLLVNSVLNRQNSYDLL